MLFYIFNFRVSLDMLSVQSNGSPNWPDKITKAFWRGRDSREERLKLVMMAKKNPDLFDAALTNFFFFKHDESKYGPKVKHVSFFDFFKVSSNEFSKQHNLCISVCHPSAVIYIIVLMNCYGYNM